MYNFDYFDAFLTHTIAFPSEVKYHNTLIDNVLKNEQLFLETSDVKYQIDTFSADENIIDIHNYYQLLKQFVLENAALLKYDTYFKCRKKNNGLSSIKYKETYDETSALQSLFFPFMILKELLQAQQLMPKFPYQAHIYLKTAKQTSSTIDIHFDEDKQALIFELNVQCASKDIYYHALGLGIAHGTYFDNIYFHSNLKQSLNYFDKHSHN